MSQATLPSAPICSFPSNSAHTALCWVSRLLSFLSGSTLDVTIKAPLALSQTTSSQVSLALQSCQPIFTRIHTRTRLLSSVTKVMLKRVLQNSLPNMLCPVVRFWFYVINQQLNVLKNVHSLALFRSLYSAFTQVPPPSEPHYHLDFQEPGVQGNDALHPGYSANNSWPQCDRGERTFLGDPNTQFLFAKGLAEPSPFPGPRSPPQVSRQDASVWKLVLVCGLLTGTSASLLGNLGDDLSNTVNKLKPAVEKGLETIDNTLDSVVQKLTTDLKKLQESKVWHLAQEKVQEVKNLVNDALSKITPVKDKTLGLNIINSRILKIKAELIPDGEGINIRVPIVANVTLALPVIGKVNLKASLDLLTPVKVAIDPQTGTPRVIIGKCSSDPDSISLTMLDSQNTRIGQAVNTLSSFLTETVSHLVEKNVCPLIHALLSTLDTLLVQDVIDKLQKENHPQNHV
ncbi:BPI fold-containing family A member 2 [Meles meles]|uniref:BPI fold-containing family A member 2 n=1 Tax=Meles meles TaxID=9662 RepID=UPI001E69EAE2|nr:BPI fold-containing family A member 2 [Meles meles]